MFTSDYEQELNLYKSDTTHPTDQLYTLPDAIEAASPWAPFASRSLRSCSNQNWIDLRLNPLPERIDWTLYHPNGSVEHCKALWNNIVLTGGEPPSSPGLTH